MSVFTSVPSQTISRKAVSDLLLLQAKKCKALEMFLNVLLLTICIVFIWSSIWSDFSEREIVARFANLRVE